jgi:hypothetical protein
LTATDVATAEREAEEARAAVADAEQAIKTGRRKVTASKLVEILGRRQHAELTAVEARDRAERDREDARRQALKALGAEIDAAAAGAGADIAEALADVADAAARVRSLASAHDTRLADLADAARALGARGVAPGGPREADERVALSGGGVVHATTAVIPFGESLEESIAHAVAGDLVSARAAVKPVRTLPVPRRAAAYFRGRGGLLVPVFSELNEGQRAQVMNGDLTPLTESQILAYLAGDAR